MQDKSCKTPRWRLLKSQLNNLQAADFKAVIDQNKNAILIDVRTASEFDFGHIPNAINIDYLAENFWEKMEALPADKLYLIYCRSGRRSIRTCTLMCNGGFDKSRIFNLEGGFSHWLEAFPKAVIRPN